MWRSWVSTRLRAEAFLASTFVSSLVPLILPVHMHDTFEGTFVVFIADDMSSLLLYSVYYTFE